MRTLIDNPASGLLETCFVNALRNKVKLIKSVPTLNSIILFSDACEALVRWLSACLLSKCIVLLFTLTTSSEGEAEHGYNKVFRGSVKILQVPSSWMEYWLVLFAKLL